MIVRDETIPIFIVSCVWIVVFFEIAFKQYIFADNQLPFAETLSIGGRMLKILKKNG